MQTQPEKRGGGLLLRGSLNISFNSVRFTPQLCTLEIDHCKTSNKYSTKLENPSFSVRVPPSHTLYCQLFPNVLQLLALTYTESA